MAGLGWAVKIKSGLPFQGRDALVSGGLLPRLLAGFAVENPEVTLLGRETIYRDGERVGWLSSGGFGYSLGKPIGYGYCANTAARPGFRPGGNYELDVAGETRARERVPGALLRFVGRSHPRLKARPAYARRKRFSIEGQSPGAKGKRQ